MMVVQQLPLLLVKVPFNNCVKKKKATIQSSFAAKCIVVILLPCQMSRIVLKIALPNY